jgi:hypothetical protein
MTLNLDLQTTIRVIFLLALLGVVLSFLLGIQSIRSGSRLYYFKKRRDLMVRGWRLIVMSFVFIGVAYVVQSYAEPVAYEFFPPSPTPSLSPTNTLSPTVTLTPSITWTPSITPTPAISNTPQVPTEIQSEFSAFITPNPEAVFSPLQFTRSIDEEKQPIEPSDLFVNPVEGAIYATFSYDKMLEGSQWTAIWYRVDGEIICYETLPWNGSTGGYGIAICEPDDGMWMPVEYELQIFNGETWVVSGRFTIEGDPPTPTPTLKPSNTPTSTYTPTTTRTATGTKAPTVTRTPTITPTASWTAGPSPTPTITKTRTPLPSRQPSWTPTRTRSPTPTRTTRPTDTRVPTNAIAPIHTPTRTRAPITITTSRPTDTLWPTNAVSSTQTP